MSKYYKCPYCGKSKDRKSLVRHIEDKHSDNIPEGFTPLRIAFNWINYKNLDYCGKCTECGGPTKWDENKGRYDRQCGSKSCHDSFVKKFEDNMMRTRGVTRMTQSIDGQEMMLANRRISGKYKFQDGGVKTYTGSYEKEALKFLDMVMNCKSVDIMSPGPTMQYVYNGESHWYIPDIYYIPYNLIIEVKDGGDKPNTRNMPEYRAKQIAKEKHIVDNTNFNYLRLTNNDFSQLLAVMSDIKLQLVDNSNERVININENMFAATAGMFPMHNVNSVYVINYTRNNAFSGESDFAVSDSPKFSSVFYRDKEGKLRKGDHKLLEDTSYDLYAVKDVKDKFESTIKGHIDQFVEEGFIYEAVFDKKLYTPDQIKFEPLAEVTLDLFAFLHESQKMMMDYIRGGSVISNEGSWFISADFGGSDEEAVVIGHMDVKTGKLYVESSSTIGLRAEAKNPIQKYMLNFIDHAKGGLK